MPKGVYLAKSSTRPSKDNARPGFVTRLKLTRLWNVIGASLAIS